MHVDRHQYAFHYRDCFLRLKKRETTRQINDIRMQLKCQHNCKGQKLCSFFPIFFCFFVHLFCAKNVLRNLEIRYNMVSKMSRSIRLFHSGVRVCVCIRVAQSCLFGFNHCDLRVFPFYFMNPALFATTSTKTNVFQNQMKC